MTKERGREWRGREKRSRCARNVTDVAWKLVRESVMTASSSLGLIVADLIIPPCSKEATAASLYTCVYVCTRPYMRSRTCTRVYVLHEQRVGRWRRVASPFALSYWLPATPFSPKLTLLALMTDSAARCARAKAGTYISWSLWCSKLKMAVLDPWNISEYYCVEILSSFFLLHYYKKWFEV